MSNLQSSLLGSQANSSWQYQANCPCYLLIPQTSAMSLSCLPYGGASESFYEEWLQCAALANTSNAPVNYTRCHMTVCGNGAVTCSSGQTTQCSSDAELHEVRCCSDTQIAGWTKRASCSVWSESDAWTGGCQILNYPTANAFCQQQGGRLCSAEEVNASCAAGTGCGHDADPIWTSTLPTGTGNDDDDDDAGDDGAFVPSSFGPVCATEGQVCRCDGSVIYGATTASGAV